MSNHVLAVTLGILSAWLTMTLSTGPAQAAVSYSIDVSVSTGNPLDSLFPNGVDQVAIDITLRSDGEGIIGLYGAAFGYDPNVVSLASAHLAPELLSTACVPSIGCFGGFTNLAAGTEVPHGSGGATTPFALGVAIAPVTGTGELDPGWDGTVGGPQIRLVFDTGAPGVTEIEFGVDPSPSCNCPIVLAGGGTAVSNNALVSFTVMPEPGTAILIGLGLGVLSHSKPTGFAARRSGN